MGCVGMRGGGGGKAYGHHLIRSLLDRQAGRQTVHDIGEGSWQARPARPDRIRSEPTRPDQTRQTDFGMLTCALFLGQSGQETLAAPSPSSGGSQNLVTCRALCICLGKTGGGEQAGRAWSRAMRLACPHRAPRWLRLVTMVTHMCYARGMCCVYDLACVGRVAVQPDALMSTQPSFHRCSRPRKKVCPPTSLAFGCAAAAAAAACLACDESGNGCGAGDPQGCPGATPRFWSLFGNRVDGKWTPRIVGVLRWFEMVAFLASASAIFWRYQLPRSITYTDSLSAAL